MNELTENDVLSDVPEDSEIVIYVNYTLIQKRATAFFFFFDCL